MSLTTLTLSARCDAMRHAPTTSAASTQLLQLPHAWPRSRQHLAGLRAERQSFYISTYDHRVRIRLRLRLSLASEPGGAKVLKEMKKEWLFPLLFFGYLKQILKWNITKIQTFRLPAIFIYIFGLSKYILTFFFCMS